MEIRAHRRGDVNDSLDQLRLDMLRHRLVAAAELLDGEALAVAQRRHGQTGGGRRQRLRRHASGSLVIRTGVIIWPGYFRFISPSLLGASQASVVTRAATVVPGSGIARGT